MKNVRSTLLAGGVAALLLAVTGCGSSGTTTASTVDFGGKATGTLAAWGFDNTDEVGTSRLDYAKDQLSSSGVKITIDATPFDAQKFTTLAASKRTPDVVQMDRQFVTTYAAKGLIMPLSTCFSANNVDPATQYYTSVMADVTYNGDVWAVPQFYQPPAIMLNTRVMKEAGVTAADLDTSKPDQLIAAAKKMTTFDGKNPTRLGFDAQPTSQAGLWMLGFGGSIIGSDGKPTLDDPNNVTAVTFLKKLEDAQGGYAAVKSLADSFDFFGDKNQFVSDQVGAEIVAQWYVNVLSPYATKVQISGTPFLNSTGEPFTVASGTAFVIPTASKNPVAACKWALDLTSAAAWDAAGEARAATIASTDGAINTGLFTGSPAADTSLRTKYVPSTGNTGFDEAIAAYYDVVGSGQSFGSSPGGQQIQTELQNAVSAALLGEKSPEDALKDGQAAALRAYTQAGGK
ncbi:ABC transporter substrate-binding protein [Glaciihabitans sp. dw_435]|uniref:ABC transporter substrate-binding protein n=1 Tax=Glaciihabitans sp. dw_435 TaxID=2720081 RepID=UPI001BD2F494|nr:extracellular solute-binding protein [Glaciihabitans sp. dw_435]